MIYFIICKNSVWPLHCCLVWALQILETDNVLSKDWIQQIYRGTSSLVFSGKGGAKTLDAICCQFSWNNKFSNKKRRCRPPAPPLQSTHCPPLIHHWYSSQWISTEVPNRKLGVNFYIYLFDLCLVPLIVRYDVWYHYLDRSLCPTLQWSYWILHIVCTFFMCSQSTLST